MNFFERFLSTFGSSQPGYIFMWLLVLIAAAAVYLIVNRSLFLNKSSNINAALFINRITKFLMEKKPDQAVALCDSAGRRALPWIVKGAIIKAEEDPRFVRSVIEERTISVIPRLEKFLVYLATLGNVSTMVGLMGTIYGLILSFAAVGAPDIDPSLKSSMLADGISAAMNTTLLGLVISIPCILFYTLYRNKVDRIIADIDRHVISLIRLLAPGESVHKSYKPSDRKTKDAVETEPNMVPIMGLMVVLIPLLLSSAEFVKIGRTTINLPQAAASADSDNEAEQKQPPKMLGLGLVITEKGINIMHALDSDTRKNDAESDESFDVPAKSPGVQNYTLLNRKLKNLKTRVLAAMLGDRKSRSFLPLYQKYRKVAKRKKFYHYQDHYNVKLLADNKISYQTIISVMDAARNFSGEKGRKYPLFPIVSMGVMR